MRPIFVTLFDFDKQVPITININFIKYITESESGMTIVHLFSSRPYEDREYMIKESYDWVIKKIQEAIGE
jgi:hypothetical protein